MHSLSKLLSFALFATAVVAVPFIKRQDDPALDPATPVGYELIFGPVDGGNNAPGYMGTTYFDTYDVQACTNACTERDPDAVGGPCVYVNIWRAFVDDVGVGSTTCSFYYTVADESTTTNTGQGSLHVTFSRGYGKILA